MKDHHELWAAFKSGDEKAFSHLYFEYYDPLYHYGLKLTANEDMVKDVIHDFYLNLYESRDRLTDKVSNLNSYLFVSFRRRLLQAFSAQTELDRRTEDTSSDHHLFVLGIEDILIRSEASEIERHVVVLLLNELPPQQREILYLRYYLDLSLSEIAEALSISYQVVANHLYRALKKLRGRSEIKKLSRRDL